MEICKKTPKNPLNRQFLVVVSGGNKGKEIQHVMDLLIQDLPGAKEIQVISNKLVHPK